MWELRENSFFSKVNFTLAVFSIIQKLRFLKNAIWFSSNVMYPFPDGKFLILSKNGDSFCSWNLPKRCFSQFVCKINELVWLWKRKLTNELWGPAGLAFNCSESSWSIAVKFSVLKASCSWFCAKLNNAAVVCKFNLNKSCLSLISSVISSFKLDISSCTLEFKLAI